MIRLASFDIRPEGVPSARLSSWSFLAEPPLLGNSRSSRMRVFDDEHPFSFFESRLTFRQVCGLPVQSPLALIIACVRFGFVAWSREKT